MEGGVDSTPYAHMTRVLIVDDDQEKVRRISAIVKDAIAGDENLDICPNGVMAKRLLRQNKYGLLILDIAIPDRADAEVSGDGGTRLLQELITRESYIMPDHIVGITAFDDKMLAAQTEFGRHSWSVIKYDRSSSEWEDVLRDKLRHMARVRTASSAGNSSFNSDLAIICALSDPELTSVLSLRWNWEPHAEAHDTTMYHRGSYTRNGESKLVHAAASSRVGMPHACGLAMKMIAHFRPRYLAMCGITAGVGEVNVGDVVAADVCWDYGSGKYVEDGGSRRFLPAPNQSRVTPGIRGKLMRLCSDQSTADAIRAEWPGGKPAEALRILLGPMASGAAVLADGSMVERVQEQHRKIAAIEMEAYGIFVAAEECSDPRPEVFVFKSVSDRADKSKSDDYQRYAAYTSARSLEQFVTKHL